MRFYDWINSKVQAQNIWDIGVLKFFVVTVGIIMGAYISDFVIQNIWYFAVISIILFILLIYRFIKS
jgi:hypothetical protein